MSSTPDWKVSLEGNGHYSIYRREGRGWGYVNYFFTIEQAQRWVDAHTLDGQTVLWEV